MFNESLFRRKVNLAEESVKKILGTERAPKLAEDVPHAYKDKYELAEWLTKTYCSSILSCLSALGVSAEQLKQMVCWANDESEAVSLRLNAEHHCKFEKEHEYEVESPTTHVKETTSVFGHKTEKLKSVTKVKEYWFNFSSSFEILAYAGVYSSSSSSSKITLTSRSQAKATLKVKSKSPPPHPEHNQRPGVDVDITWLLKHLAITEKGVEVQFSIARDHAECKTPRRNEEVEDALTFFVSLRHWANTIQSYFSNTLMKIDPDHSNLNFSAINANEIVNSLAPFFESDQVEGEPQPMITAGDDAQQQQQHGSSKKRKKKSASGKSAAVATAASDANKQLAQLGERVAPATQYPDAEEEADAQHTTLSLIDGVVFIAEHQRTLSAKLAALEKAFPEVDSSRVATGLEAGLATIAIAMRELVDAYQQFIAYLEHMLRQQLIAAIGKEVTPDDFNDYMVYHARRLFVNDFQPRAFCFAIRRPAHTPEGVISLERYRAGKSGNHEPVTTISMNGRRHSPMRFTLDASTEVELFGQTYVHAAIGHQFQDSGHAPLRVTARARQFSGFVLMLGRVAGAELLDITDAIIVANKTEINIPLDPETIPTAAEFRDAIESLSPAQQRFAKAYRSMQLSHTLFCLVVVQIKPQLERLLNLGSDALTKKIQLTEDLKSLFMKYQIPSDLLSYGGEKSNSDQKKVKDVEGYVAAMNKMIDSAKEEEIRQQKQAAELAVMDAFAERERQEERVAERSRSSLKKKSKGMAAPRRAMAGAAMAMNMAPTSSAIPPPAPASAPAPMLEQAKSTPPEPAPAPVVVSQPTSDSVKPQQSQQQVQQQDASTGDIAALIDRDVSTLPNQLDAAFLEIGDEGGSVRPTILNVGKVWSKSEQRGLMREPESSSLYADQRKKEKQEALDLIDALSRSGSLAIDDAEIHVVLAATHCFEKSIMNVVIQDNMNPIEKVEQTLVTAAQIIHAESTEKLVVESELERLGKYSPKLFL